MAAVRNGNVVVLRGARGEECRKKEGERKGEEGEGRRKDEEGRRGKLREEDIETFIQDIIYIFI